MLDAWVGGVLQELLVDVILQVVENFLGVLLIAVDPLFNSIAILIDLFNTILSLFSELLLLVHDISFVLFLSLSELADFPLELFEVLFDISVDRLQVGFHIVDGVFKLLKLTF